MRLLRFAPALLCLALAACSSSSEPDDTNNNNNNDPALTTSSITMKVDGVSWHSVIVQSSQSNTIFNGAGTNGGFILSFGDVTTTGEVPFTSSTTVSGPHADATFIANTGTTSTMYLTIVEDGTAKLNVTKLTDTEIRGTFNCKLKASSGATITITDGVFGLKLK